MEETSEIKELKRQLFELRFKLTQLEEKNKKEDEETEQVLIEIQKTRKAMARKMMESINEGEKKNGKRS